MGNPKEVTTKCFVGQTKYSAGIFLSQAIAKRKPYYAHLRLEAYASFEEAYGRFFELFEDVIPESDFKVNKLFRVREDCGWSVAYCREFVCLLETYNAAETFENVFGCFDGFVYWKHGMEYEQAVAFANCKLAQSGYFNTHQVLPPIRTNVPIFLRT